MSRMNRNEAVTVRELKEAATRGYAGTAPAAPRIPLTVGTVARWTLFAVAAVVVITDPIAIPRAVVGLILHFFA